MSSVKRTTIVFDDSDDELLSTIVVKKLKETKLKETKPAAVSAAPMGIDSVVNAMINGDFTYDQLKKAYTKHCQMKFQVNDRVRFLGKSGETLEGTIIKINPKFIKIMTTTGKKWRVVPPLLTKIDSPKVPRALTLPANASININTVIQAIDAGLFNINELWTVYAYRCKNNLKVGDSVSFRIKTNEIVEGVITKINHKTIQIVTQKGLTYKVTPSLLTKLDKKIEPAKKNDDYMQFKRMGLKDNEIDALIKSMQFS